MTCHELRPVGECIRTRARSKESPSLARALGAAGQCVFDLGWAVESASVAHSSVDRCLAPTARGGVPGR